jgi:EpsI family protein
MSVDRRIVAIALCLLAILLGGARLGNSHVPADRWMISDLPRLDGCIAQDGVRAVWVPSFVGASKSWSVRFDCDGSILDIGVGVWLEQSVGREAVSDDNPLVPSEWRFEAAKSSFELHRGVALNEYEVRRDDRDLVVWNWYAVGRKSARDDVRAKWLEAVEALRMRPQPTAIFSMAAESPDDSTSRELLRTQSEVLWRWYLNALGSA